MKDWAKAETFWDILNSWSLVRKLEEDFRIKGYILRTLSIKKSVRACKAYRRLVRDCLEIQLLKNSTVYSISCGEDLEVLFVKLAQSMNNLENILGE